MNKLLAAGAALSMLATPALAQTADQVRHARCFFVKSNLLSSYLDDAEPDQDIIAGLVANITYFFGRLEASMERPMISNLIVSEGERLQTDQQVADAEPECDALIEDSMNFMTEVGERLDGATG